MGSNPTVTVPVFVTLEHGHVIDSQPTFRPQKPVRKINLTPAKSVDPGTTVDEVLLSATDQLHRLRADVLIVGQDLGRVVVLLGRIHLGKCIRSKNDSYQRQLSFIRAASLASAALARAFQSVSTKLGHQTGEKEHNADHRKYSSPIFGHRAFLLSYRG